MSSTEKTHDCEECDTSFESKEELDKHNKEEHADKQPVTKIKERCVFFSIMKIIGDRLDTILEWSKSPVLVDIDRNDAAITNRNGESLNRQREKKHWERLMDVGMRRK